MTSKHVTRSKLPKRDPRVVASSCNPRQNTLHSFSGSFRREDILDTAAARDAEGEPATFVAYERVEGVHQGVLAVRRDEQTRDTVDDDVEWPTPCKRDDGH